MTLHISRTPRVLQEIAPSPHITWGTPLFPPDAFLVLHIGATGRQAFAPRKPEILIGRTTEGTQTLLDMDLAPFEGAEHGVSRLHAALIVANNQVSVMDTGSTNGTWLRGKKLEPHRPTIIREGDDLQFGTLLTYVYFIERADTASA